MQGSSRVTGKSTPLSCHLYSLCCPSAIDWCLDHRAGGGDVEPAPALRTALPSAFSALFVETAAISCFNWRQKLLPSSVSLL